VSWPGAASGSRGSARNIPVVFSSWRDDPTDELIKEIQQAVVSCVPGAAAAEFPQTRLEEAVEAASQAGDATLLVMLDQFEEYFLYRSREARAGRFADELAACVNRPGLHANFLISIREDAYSSLGDLFKSRIPNVYGNYLHLEHLSRECARLAIEKPIASFNELHEHEPPVEIEPALVDNVLDQLRPDQFKADAGAIGGLPDGNGPGRGGDGIAAPLPTARDETTLGEGAGQRLTDAAPGDSPGTWRGAHHRPDPRRPGSRRSGR
jgi:hypothetical protein